MSNPALNESTWARINYFLPQSTMTIQGTINKTGFLVVMLVIGAYLGKDINPLPVVWWILIMNLIIFLLIMFQPHRAAYLSQPYAILEGMLLGIISTAASKEYPGIAANALIGTVACLLLMIALFRMHVIYVTDRLRALLVSATGAIALTYLVDLGLQMYGMQIPFIHEASPMGILFSIGVIMVASFRLIRDFTMIEKAYNFRSPRFMEWYCAFALILSLVWLYLEVLSLMGKLKKR